MKGFEVFRYIKKWRYLIIAVCILGVLLVYRYAMSRQTYTAQTILRYTNAEAKSGMTPSGDTLDVTEIYSSNVITGVLEDLGLDTGADSIRSKCQVEPIIPDDEIERKTAILKEGGEYEYNPTDYLVTFRVGSEYSKEYASSVLDSILKNYFVVYGDKYINQTVLPNNASNVKDGTYDYIESAEILDSSAMDIYNYLYDKKFHYPYFRSAATGYTFNDLYNMYSKLLSYDVPELSSKILNQKVSKNQDVLIKDYRNRISQYNIELSNLQNKVDPLYDLITRYSSKSKDGMQYHYGKNDNSTGSDDYILKDVYDENGETRKVYTQTTYDSLINQYVKLEVSRQYTKVDMEHKQMLLDTFDSATPADDAGAAVRDIESSMDDLIKTLDDYYKIVNATVDEFNQYMGATNILTLTSVNVSERINVKLYLMIAILLFLICGCLGAIFLGRIQDFVEFMVYADKKTKLPNRSKCDDVINSYEARPLEDNFTFILIRLDILKQVNSQVGRTAGDTLLGEFGAMLGNTARDYGFVGYNGSDQFMCLFENCSYKKAEMFIVNLASVVEHYNSQNPQQKITFSYAIEESKTTGIYEARGLIAAAFKDINTKGNTNTNINSDTKPNNDNNDDDPNDTNPTGGGSPSGGGNPSGGLGTKPTGGGADTGRGGIVNPPSAEAAVTKAAAPPAVTEKKQVTPKRHKPEEEYSRIKWSEPEGKKPVYRAVTVREERVLPKNAAESKPKAEKKSEPAEPPVVQEVPIVVKNVAESSSSDDAGFDNPYAPKPRAKKRYHSNKDSEINFDSYAPKRNRRS